MSDRPDLAALSPAERHRVVAARFSGVVAGVGDWDAPTPVAGWAARDVVHHLVEWFPGFLAAGGIALPAGPPAATDPVEAWAAQARAVQALLDDPDRASATFTHPQAGTDRLDAVIDRFYTTDVFLHAWDLARASGGADRLDPDFCAVLLAGMEPIEAMIRASGQFGERVPVADGADVVDRLVAFIGRDPGWRPPA